MRMCGAIFLRLVHSCIHTILLFFSFCALVTAWLFSVPTLSPTRHSLCRKIRLSPQSGIKAQSSAQPTYEKSHSWALGWSAGTCLAARQQINAAVAAVCPGENTPRILPFSPLPSRLPSRFQQCKSWVTQRHTLLVLSECRARCVCLCHPSEGLFPIGSHMERVTMNWTYLDLFGKKGRGT